MFPPYMRKAPQSRPLMRFGKKTDLKKMTTVSQFGHFGGIFSSLGGVPDKGEFLRWFPPYMKKAPLSASAGSRSDRLGRLCHM